MPVVLAKQVYRYYRAQGLKGLLGKLSSASVWRNGLPHLLQFRDPREALARKYLKGSGLEIGALHRPLKVPLDVSVKYVDRVETGKLHALYPTIENLSLVDVDIVDNGETLSKVPENSQDFIIANHFIEHCENPLGTVRQHLSRLRSGGILYYAVPNKRHTFDVKRPLTSFEHLVRDDREGPEISRRDHYREWLELVKDETDPATVEDRIREYMQTNFNIHFHVWNEHTLSEFWSGARGYLGNAFEIVENRVSGSEVIAILRKS